MKFYYLFSAAVASIPNALALHNEIRPRVQKYRSLQQKQAACSAPVDEALLKIEGTMNGKMKLPTIRTSLYENCMDALEVNPTNILQHVHNLEKSFKQYE